MLMNMDNKDLRHYKLIGFMSSKWLKTGIKQVESYN